MKKFKSILALTASVLALSAFAAPVSAFATGGDAINTANGTGQSTVEDTITGGFIVTIPANVDFASTSATNATDNPLKADNGENKPIILDNGHTLKVYVKSANGCQLKQADSSVTDYISYTITTANGANNATGAANDTPLSGSTDNITGDTDNKGVLLATFQNKEYDTVNLTFAEGSETVAAGTYRDTLTFTIVDAAS